MCHMCHVSIADLDPTSLCSPVPWAMSSDEDASVGRGKIMQRHKREMKAAGKQFAEKMQIYQRKFRSSNFRLY